ncbi:MAG: hypothetical protein H6995_09200 [Pseudomonadales bacterium]|nr:hypothetical protein [Pseudomonadales bacterium]
MIDFFEILMAFLAGSISEHVKSKKISRFKVFLTGFFFTSVGAVLVCIPVWLRGDGVQERVPMVVGLILVASIAVGLTMVSQVDD